MFLRKFRLSFMLSDVDSTLHSLFSKISEPDLNIFLKKLKEVNTLLSPKEAVLACNYLDKIANKPNESGFSHSEISQIKKSLINHFRSKLYLLSDPNQLCKVTILISDGGILTESYVRDFLTRLDKLLCSINFEDIPVICDCLIMLNARGYKIDNTCIKFYNVLASDNTLETIDNLSLFKVFECYTSLNINNKLLENKLVAEIKARVNQNKVPEPQIVNLIKSNSPEKSKLLFLNQFLLSKLLNDNEIDLITLVAILNNCKRLNRDFEKVDQIYLSHRDKLSLFSEKITLQLKLDLLTSFARFRYKPQYLNDLLESISVHLEELSFEDLTILFVNIFYLNLHSDSIIDHFKETLNHLQSNFYLNYCLEYNNNFTKLLLAMSYFCINDHGIFNNILYEIIRNEHKMTDQDKINLQRFYSILKSGYSHDNLINLINEDILKYLHNNSKCYQTQRTKDLDHISNLITQLSHGIYEQANIGGYYLNFIIPRQMKSRIKSGHFDPQEGIGITIAQFYKSQTGSEGLEETSEHVLMKRILKNLNINFVEISMHVLEGLNRSQRLEYLAALISKASEPNLSNRSNYFFPKTSNLVHA
ncbi:uncharacterized protein TA16075 [Theileria annulata]|uniref:Uncharacterized protein n=1 Tax=Theileria annulata TaxID=5874 RepID=Q4UDH2_THEAN|nr:uncharacterized protein TA16075 [Theileria annulata]CAI74867.1 hypothetical protein TA16075 [Theileria annulata]|eukprot:XP_952599.1 hypothetical protein TA16075 [Theileria annulata]